MKLKVYVIDFETPRWVRRLVAYVAPVVLVLGVAAIALAGNLVTWTDGQPLKAADLNSNFASLQSQINALQAFQVQATADGGYSLGATFCGVTAATAGSFSGPGTLTGYASAKAQCQAVSTCSPTAAHMCTSDEVVRTRQRGEAITYSPAGYAWYASGVYATYAGDGQYDCGGWSEIGSTSFGSAWSTVTVSPNNDVCSNSHPILCCN